MTPDLIYDERMHNKNEGDNCDNNYTAKENDQITRIAENDIVKSEQSYHHRPSQDRLQRL